MDDTNFQEWKKRIEDECEARKEEIKAKYDAIILQEISSIKAHYDEIILRAQQQRLRTQQQHDAVMRQLEANEHNRVQVCTDISNVCATVFEYLMPKEIMSCRRVCKPWEEAAKVTTVPLKSYFEVDSVESYNAMRVMTRALPKLQELWLCRLGQGSNHKWSEGEDPTVASFVNRTSHDIEIISNFSKLRELSIYNTLMNGRYPFLFNSFPLLQKLSIQYCKYLKWDLDMLAGLPSLKELDCHGNPHLTGNINSLWTLKGTLKTLTIYACPNVEGNINSLRTLNGTLKKLTIYNCPNVEGNINSLRTLKDTLEKVKVEICPLVKGNFMDLADFPYLKELNLFITDVTGDIRDIGENDFSSLERLMLPHGVYGGLVYEFQRISDAPDQVRAVYLLKQQRPSLEYLWFGKLSEESPDWYRRDDEADGDSPPFSISLVQAGPRVGYRWKTSYHGDGKSCEINWLDPEPDRASSEYERYIEELEAIEAQVTLYRGFHRPPTQEEYTALFEERRER